MSTPIYWIHTFSNSAKIGIMARPRGGDWLEDEINHLKKNNVCVLVSLLEREEIYELGLEAEQQACEAKSITFINFPIRDRDIPKRNSGVDSLVNLIASRLNDNNTVVIHCRMGIGRSSIIAGAVLLKYKLKAQEVINAICSIRGLKVPDTDEQLLWLKARE